MQEIRALPYLAGAFAILNSWIFVCILQSSIVSVVDQLLEEPSVPAIKI